MIVLAQNYILLERIELAASAASVTFSNIPQSGYTDLKVVGSTLSSSLDDIHIQLGTSSGISTTGYTYKVLRGSGSAAASFDQTAWTTPGPLVTYSGGATSTPSNFEVYIPNYTSNNYKSLSVDGVEEANATAAYMVMTAGLWSNTGAVSKVSLVTTNYNFTSGSTFSLYGLAAVGTTPAIAPKAFGGNIIETDGTYWYHAFTASGTFTPDQPLSCDVLVLSGGGGGGSDIAGGGGAGGILGYATQSLVSNSYLVTIGAGGAQQNTAGGQGNDGNVSTFQGLTSPTGGGGGGGYNVGVGDGRNGGSGGGSTFYLGSANFGGTGVSGQGFAGGRALQSGASNTGGSGGGAGGLGNDGTSNNGVAGGLGTNSVTNWGSLATMLSLTGLGSSGRIAAGGGSSGTSGGAGGTGGGGAGGNFGGNPTASAGSAAIAATGSGGGAGGNGGGRGGAGGSGLIVIRYPIA